MTNSDPNMRLLRARHFLQDPLVSNLHAQAHARAILRQLGRPAEDWPHFRPDLDERLHHVAHHLLWSALQLIGAGRSIHDVRPLLVAAAESWEFISADPEYDAPIRVEQAVNATFAYYLAGHYARSFVLLREAIPEATALPPILGLLVSVFRKQLREARRITSGYFAASEMSDERIAEELERGRVSHDEAYHRILLTLATRAVSHYLEFPKSGDPSLLERGIAVLDDAILIARELRFADWWWWLYCLRFLFREFGDASPWALLGPSLGGGEGKPLVERYIRAGLRCQPPILELWPSQAAALPAVNDADRRDFCLKMPTSAGKTRIAELAILRFLVDYQREPQAKCIYLAPFRSLAVEVEGALRRSLSSLGVEVSQIYGGFEITPADVASLDQYRVLIATPEKFDSLLRFVPELADSVRLVIIDEGHIIEPGDRGLRFEFFVHRLLRRLPRPACRFVFISAVLPNAAQFAEWITGSPDGLVESDWRPTRQMLGRLTWDGSTIRIDYTHQGHAPFGQDCFVPRFIERVSCEGVSGLGRRRKPFPADAGEAFASAALLFAREGTTLVFVPQKRNTEAFGRALLAALRVQRSLSDARGESFDLPVPGRGTPAWHRCRQVIEAELGGDSNLLGLLDEGILIHHGNLPWRVRVAIEELARSDGVRLIVATTTLAQGVNLPIKTVLVRGLHVGHNQLISPMTFWNICGRAGRAMKENEGQILFCIDRTAEPRQRQRLEHDIVEVLRSLDRVTVVSAMFRALRTIITAWVRAHPILDLASLCMYLAEDRFDWALPGDQGKLRSLVDVMDGHLLALSEELGLDPADPDTIQGIVQGSLLEIQLRCQEVIVVPPEAATGIFSARIGHIYRAHPDASVRRRLYRLGMSLSSCLVIENAREELLALYLEARAWNDWMPERRRAQLARLAHFILQIPDTAPESALPPEWQAILLSWLGGVTVPEMIVDGGIRRFTDDPGRLGALIEELCGYRLPWGLNGISSYLSDVSEGSVHGIPRVCAYFAGMVKYGVDDPVAVCIVPYVDQDRRLALAAASVCPFSCEQPRDVIEWILEVTAEELIDLGLSRATAGAVIERRGWRSGSSGPQRERRSMRLTLRVCEGAYRLLSSGQELTIDPYGEDEPFSFRVYTLSGEPIGRYRWSLDPIPEWWRDSSLLEAHVREKWQRPDGTHYGSIEVIEV